MSSFDVPALIWKFAPKDAPPVSLTAPQNCVLLLAASLRASCQVTATFPVVWSRDMLGRNWLLVVASSLTLTRGLHVAPLSVENRTKLSVSLLSSGASSV